MSKLSDKIDWAVDTFNQNIKFAISTGENLTETTEKNIGLLLNVSKIYPSGKFPAWARRQLTPEATKAVETYEKNHCRTVL